MQAAHERGASKAELLFPVWDFRQKTVDIGRLSADQDANRTQDFDKECHTRMPSRLLKKPEILASSFDKLRMRLSVFNELILMVSLSNHGQHRFSAAC
jgi:hypothetical protein